MKLLQGDCLEKLAELPEGSVQCCVTSPPYWGLRDYGADGQLGLEKTPAEYVENLVKVFREVRRVLRDDGTLWLNLGDSYCSQPSACQNPRSFRRDRMQRQDMDKRAPGLKVKDLCGIPWRAAFALQEDGWYLRSDIIWSKPNPMPESVTDRPTKAHEYIFLFAKNGTPLFWTHRDGRRSDKLPEPDYEWSNKETEETTQIEPADWRENEDWMRRNLWRGHDYFYDAEAVKEKQNETTRRAASFRDGGVYTGNRSFSNSADNKKDTHGDGTPSIGRNRRSVWTMATQPYPEAHFATFPELLPALCIKAGTKEGDTVLDPFAGAGTTGLVAIRLQRDFVGVELNEKYCNLIKKRLASKVPLLIGGAS